MQHLVYKVLFWYKELPLTSLMHYFECWTSHESSENQLPPLCKYLWAVVGDKWRAVRAWIVCLHWVLMFYMQICRSEAEMKLAAQSNCSAQSVIPRFVNGHRSHYGQPLLISAIWRRHKECSGGQGGWAWDAEQVCMKERSGARPVPGGRCRVATPVVP